MDFALKMMDFVLQIKCRDRRKNETELVALMEEIYLTKTWDEWEALFEDAGVWYQKVQSVEDVIADPQAAPAWVPLPPSKRDLSEGVESITTVASPVDFDGTTPHPAGPVPSVGEHTAEVLLEFRLDAVEAARLHEKGLALKSRL